jgi:hypothetical protein
MKHPGYLVCLQITEITRKLARRKYLDKNQFTSSVYTMYALVDFSLFKIIAEDDQKCEEDISSGCWRPGPFGPGQKATWLCRSKRFRA